MPPHLIGYALLATSVASGAASVHQARRAASLEKKQQGAQMRMQEVETRRKQMEQLARARALRATMFNTTEQTGTGDSSSAGGMAGSIGASAAGNVSFLESGLASARFITQLNRQEVNARSDAAVFGAVSDVAGTFAEATGGYKNLAKLFE